MHVNENKTTPVQKVSAEALNDSAFSQEKKGMLTESKWATDEREADEDILAGRVKTFDNMEALLEDLDNES